MLIFSLFQDKLPEEVKVELVSDDVLTNVLLILNIVFTLITSFIAANYIQKRIKTYEVQAHKDKIVSSKRIQFCLKTLKRLKSICSKNPNEISDEDINIINKILISENNAFLDRDTEKGIKEFGDYLINLKQTPEIKDIETEKYFFYKLRKYLNS